MKSTRRQILGVLGLSALASLPGGAVAQTLANDAGVQGVPLISGDSPEPPSVEAIVAPARLNSPYAYYYIGSDDSCWYIDHEQSDWGHLDTVLVDYAQSNLPADPTDGTLVYDNSRGVPAWRNSDRWRWPNFVDNQDVLIEAQPVANEAAKTEVFTIDMKAGSMIQGRIFQLDLMGAFSTANTSDQFTVIVEIDGNEMAALQNAAANVSDAPWMVEVTFTVRSHGQNGTIQPHSMGVFDGTPADDHHAEFNIDTTVIDTISVSIDWDAADPDNSVTLGQAHLKQMA